jgi:mannan endo-1,4-beta-mannosidase
MGGELSDLVSYQGFYPNQDALSELIRHGQTGNIVTLVWHPDNPTQGDFSTPISTADLQNVVNLNTDVGQRFQAQLDQAAAVLQQFQNANVPVLFRPMHEQNGNFFWWGDDGSSGADQRKRQAAWVTMWRKMVTELTSRKGLQNLLFVFCINNHSDNSVASPLAYYPGGAWTDVVSMDVYNDQLNLAGDERGIQQYTTLISTGKPFGLSEFGQETTGQGASAWDARTLVNRVYDAYPRTTFAVAWYSATEDGVEYVWALPDLSHTRELLTDPLIYTQPH